ncbi:transglutaminase domain-containing protein [Metalysinibacillus jejuensis]|uniref:transglutaminase domain-containing protein n=1 Tax=Metalysinibacillus jejuensis TaxID=914327 RepID=UPI000D3BF63C|nr:transglutaminase domain-containing protein [Metalysinibacillus jejuensis]
MRKWLMFIILMSSFCIVPHATAQEIQYGYDEAFDEVVYAVASEQLSEDAYVLYEQLKIIMQARQTEFSVTYEGVWSQAQTDFRQAISAVLREDEYLAYDYLGYRYTSRGYDGLITFTGTANYIQNAEQVAYVSTHIKEILPTIITPQMGDYEKVKAVHDYVVTNVAYDTTMNQAVNAPYFAITGGETLCNGYAMLVHQMLKEVNVPVRLISGTAGHNGNVENHAWNLVQVGGKWFHLDATWNDPIPDVAGRIIYNYYLLNDREISKDHFWQDGGLNNHDAPYPRATTELFMHLALTGRLDVQRALANGLPVIHTEQALTTYVEGQFATHNPKFTVLYQGGGSYVKAIQQALTGNEQGVRYQTTRHRLPNTTQVTITVQQYQGSPSLPSIKSLAFTPQLPATVTVGERLPLKVQAIYTDNTVKDVTANVDWHITGAIWQADEVNFSTVGEANINATLSGQTVSQRVTVQPPLFVYPIAGIEALKPVYNVATTKVWHVNFSNPINRATNVRVVNRFGQQVPIEVRIHQLQLRIAPLTPYQKGETYYLLLQGIGNEAHDLPPQSMAFTIG